MTALVVSAAAALAVWLLVPPAAGARPVGSRWLRESPQAGPGTVVGPAGGAVPFATAGLVAGVLVVLLDGTALALGLVVAAAAGGMGHLARRARSRREADARAERVLEVCEALAGEVRAGRPPVQALRSCTEVWPALEPVVAAAELGGDVPAALRRLGRRPGASGLAEVAAAWQVSETAGAALAPALMQVAESARRRSATRRLVAAELASAQATARVVALLPVVVLAAGSGLGGDPWRFLLATPLGLACLAGGVALLLAGLTWIEHMAARAADP